MQPQLVTPPLARPNRLGPPVVPKFGQTYASDCSRKYSFSSILWLDGTQQQPPRQHRVVPCLSSHIASLVLIQCLCGTMGMWYFCSFPVLRRRCVTRSAERLRTCRSCNHHKSQSLIQNYILPQFSSFFGPSLVLMSLQCTHPGHARSTCECWHAAVACSLC